MKLNKIDKYISKFADKVEHSQTTNSKYYYVCGNCLRVSDHGGFNPQYQWSIILDQRNPDNYILMGSPATSMTVMTYEETKSFVKSWVMMSQTIPAKLKNDKDDILSRINCKLGDIQSYISAKPKIANDVVDLSKLTFKQLEMVQSLVLENQLSKNKIEVVSEENSKVISMDEFTKGQMSTIRAFLKQNQKKTMK